MITHFTNARLVNPETLTDDIGSLTIDGDKIHALNTPAPKSATIIDCQGLCLAPGIVDIGVKIGEPEILNQIRGTGDDRFTNLRVFQIKRNATDASVVDPNN